MKNKNQYYHFAVVLSKRLQPKNLSPRLGVRVEIGLFTDANHPVSATETPIIIAARICPSVQLTL
jgi:hypothetical protein